MTGIRSGMDRLFVVCDNKEVAKSVTGKNTVVGFPWKYDKVGFLCIRYISRTEATDEVRQVT